MVTIRICKYTKNFLKQLDETAEHLGDYINLYQIHSATFESGVLTNKQVHDALAKCRQERNWSIGLSVSSPQQSDIIREAMKINVSPEGGGDELPLFDSVQCTYNVLEQSPLQALQQAHERGMDIIIKEGLANGRVLSNPAILKYSKQLNCNPDTLALACILAQTGFEPHVLSGAITPEQLVSNLDAIQIAESKLKNDPELLETIMNECIMDSNAYWSERSSLSWN